MPTRNFVPSDIATCVEYWDAYLGVTLDGNGLATGWRGQKSGINAYANSGIAPGFSSTARNGAPGLLFAGGKWLNFDPSNAFPAGGSPSTIWLQAFTNDVPDELGLFSYGTGDNLKWRAMGKTNGGRELAVGLYSSDAGTSVKIRAADRFISWRSNGNANTVDADTDTQSFTLSTPNTVLSQGAIGRYNYGAQQTFLGAIQGCGVFSEALSDDDFKRMRGWASWRFGRNGADLPADDPYKNGPPTVSTGGADYPVSLADSATFTDSAAIQSVNFRVSITDTWVLTDTSSARAAARVSTTDTGTLTEASAAAAAAVTSTADTAVLTDSNTKSVDAVASLADTAVLTEDRGVSAYAVTGTSDAPALTDTVTAATASAANASTADTGTLTDAQSARATASAPGGDTGTLTDGVSAAVAVSLVVSDTLAPVEATNLSLGFVMSLADTGALAEGAPARADARVAALDTGFFADVFAVRAAARATLTDFWTYTENNSYSLVPSSVSSVTDTVSLQDVVTVTVSAVVVIGDYAAIQEYFPPLAGLALRIGDILAVNDFAQFSTGAWFPVDGYGIPESPWQSVEITGDGWQALPKLPNT